MIKNKRIRILLICLVLGLVLTIGLSFGYYMLNRVQDNNSVAGSKCFKLELSNEANAVNLDNMYPISDTEGKSLTPYTFTVTNTCDMLASYTVNMEMLEGTTLNSRYLDVMVNSEEIKLLNKYESTDTVLSGSTESRTLTKGILSPGDSVDYSIRFWMDEDVEDAESMSKYFASKIVVVANPNTWNPKDAGYDSLHDAILANEYQSSPEDAVSNIENKNSSNVVTLDDNMANVLGTSPSVYWVENLGNTKKVFFLAPALSVIENDTSNDKTSNLTENETLVKLYRTKEFDSTLGRYILSNPVLVDPTDETIYTDSDGNTIVYYYTNQYFSEVNNKLVMISNFSSLFTYEISGAVKEYVTSKWNKEDDATIKYTMTAKELNKKELEVDKSDKGLYAGTDDFGTTYYYRGNVKNNNVYFGGYYWKIIRINGDDTIRLIYNGSRKNARGLNLVINNDKYSFNTASIGSLYTGYMYGDIAATDLSDYYANKNDSLAKTKLDKWYEDNLLNFSSYLSDSAGFCGDRTISDNVSEDDILKGKLTFSFQGTARSKNNLATFICKNINRDFYTTSGSKFGNNALVYPIGLITYDELLFSGVDVKHLNSYSYTYSDVGYWTMTPALFYANSVGRNFYFNSTGFIDSSDVSTPNNIKFGLRPVINLKSDVKITGGIGTANDPFVIDTNN